MGGKSSKPVTDSAGSKKEPLAIVSRAPAKEEKTHGSTAVDKRPVFKGSAEEAILFLNVKFSLDLLKLIAAYWDFKFDFDEEKSIVLSPTINMSPRWHFFGVDLLPGKAANCVVWGFPEKVEAIINDNPYVMLVNTKASDHIDTTEGALFEIALLVGDVLIKDAKGRTMAGMIEHHLRAHFGEQEVQKQKNRVRSILGQREEKDLANRAEDKNALQVVWRALADSKATDPSTLVDDQDLMKAFAALEKQLKTQGDWMILVDAEQLYEREYYNLGGRNTFKNNFYEDRILGAIESRRWRAWELQVLFFGVCKYKAGVVVPRCDIHSLAGFAAGSTDRLGLNFSLDISGPRPGGREWPPDFVDLSIWQTFFEQKRQHYRVYAAPSTHQGQPSEVEIRRRPAAMAAGQ